MAGGTVNGLFNDFALVRFNSDGTLDISFGTGGKVTTDFGLSTQGFSYAQANSIALQQDGKIVLAGTALLNSVRNFALVRYNSNGTLDTGFSTGGKVTTPFSTPNPSFDNASAESVAVQPDGKIVAAGLAAFDIALARYNSNGTLDTSFGTGGEVTTSISPSYDQAFSVAVQQDGKIVVAGRTVTLSDGNFHSALARYNSDGMLDTTFGTGGSVTNIFAAANEAVSSIAVQLDGKLVAAGGANFTGNSDFALARFTLAVNPSLASLLLNPTTVTGGGTSTATVTLSLAAPAGGAVVTLASSNVNVATVPASITIPAGVATGTFTISTKLVAAATPVTIAATYNGASKTATLNVNPPLATLLLNPTTVTGGGTSTATVTLSSVAPAGGAVVTLASSNVNVATVPASITIPAGVARGTFTISTKLVTAATPVTITAAYNSASKTATLVLNPPLASLLLNPTTVTGGGTSTATVTLSSVAPAGGG